MNFPGLILAGDILSFNLMKQHDDFINFCSDHFKATYWIPGNHEYYHSDIEYRSSSFIENMKENVFLLNNQVVEFQNLELIFTTLWSHIPPLSEKIVQRSVNDFYQIKKEGLSFTVADFNILHHQSISFLKKSFSTKTNKERIIITHHVPTLLNYPPQYKTSTINSAFVVELFEWIEDSCAAYWIFGHHHFNFEPFVIGKTIMLTNQLGYVANHEHNIFNRSAILEI